MIKAGDRLNVLQSIERKGRGSQQKSDLYKIGVAFVNKTKAGDPLINLKIGPTVVLSGNSEVILMKALGPQVGEGNMVTQKDGAGQIDDDIPF